MEDLSTEKPSDLKILQLQWKPHFDYLDAGDLMTLKYDIRDQIRHLERLYVLCAVESRNALSGLSTSQSHLEKYRFWLDRQFERFQQSGYPLVEDSMQLARMDGTDRRKLIPKVLEQCQQADGWAPATAIWRAFDQAVNVFEGRTDYLDLLLQGGVLTGIYSWYNDMWGFKDFLQLLGHNRPQLRVLEIGAGTGGLTAKFLEQLKSDFGERLYLKYTYSDISSGFFVQAKERFRDYEGFEYKTLDVSKDPLEQGFDAGQYDLIISSDVCGYVFSSLDSRPLTTKQVLHTTPTLHDTLTNVRTLLQPDGQLFLQELCPGKYSIYDLLERLLTDAVTRAMSFIMVSFHYSLYIPNLSYILQFALNRAVPNLSPGTLSH